MASNPVTTTNTTTNLAFVTKAAPEPVGHDFRVVTGPTGNAAFVFMDGVMLEGVTDVEIDVHVNEPTKITITFVAGSLNQEDQEPLDKDEIAAIKVLDNDKDLEQLIRRSIEEGDIDTRKFREMLIKKAKGLT